MIRRTVARGAERDQLSRVARQRQRRDRVGRVLPHPHGSLRVPGHLVARDAIVVTQRSGAEVVAAGAIVIHHRRAAAGRQAVTAVLRHGVAGRARIGRQEPVGVRMADRAVVAVEVRLVIAILPTVRCLRVAHPADAVAEAVRSAAGREDDRPRLPRLAIEHVAAHLRQIHAIRIVHGVAGGAPGASSRHSANARRSARHRGSARNTPREPDPWRRPRQGRRQEPALHFRCRAAPTAARRLIRVQRHRGRVHSRRPLRWRCGHRCPSR